eukprot:TRINITY_DN72337_c0_g1_i1.p1 TRINITY_DN72337_c0_g1~~TRINITY_DN72337_c0_g1_i1.p1  ORF type:complete len:294 (-),score=75.41 TRINITY_DN72337_c0_g1_i1:84-965(-)
MVEVGDLDFGLKVVAAGGNVLNCQEITCLQAALGVLKSSERLQEVYFWGKIFGSGVGGEQAKGPSDYFICYGLSAPEFEFPAKTFFFACEDFVFKPLPRLTDELADKIIELGLDAPITGVPDRVVEPPKEGEAEEAGDPAEEEAADKPKKLTEADCLAQIVAEIDFDTAVVPKGAYALNEEHSVIPSSGFRGLGLTESTALAKYVHFRPPTSVAALRALARSDIQFYSDFMDGVDGDLPKGCWAVRQDPSLSTVTLRSLMWPGYIGYHAPGTNRFGGLYFGYGQKNRDLPFIL